MRLSLSAHPRYNEKLSYHSALELVASQRRKLRSGFSEHLTGSFVRRLKGEDARVGRLDSALRTFLLLLSRDSARQP